MTHDEALDVMRRDAGFAFDPAVFATFEAVVREGPKIQTGSTDFSAPSTDAGTAPLALDVTSDHVTGLPLRRSIERITTQVLADRKATNGTVSVLVIELETNTQWSDVQRRRVLRWIARELRAVTRASDFVARTGDDQFMALLPNSSEPQARSIMARVESALGRRLRQKTIGSSTTLVRMAVVASPKDGDTAEELFASGAKATAMSSSRERTYRVG